MYIIDAPLEEECKRTLSRNNTQLKDALRYRETAEMMEGKDLTDTGVLSWYIEIGLAVMFYIAWREGQKELNLYYTGLEVGHPPTPPEGWEHLVKYWQSLVYSESCPA